MKEITKKLNQKTLVSWLNQPIGIILLASLTHFGCCQARDSQAPRLSLEIISDISKLPDEAVQAFVANVSGTAIDPTGCQLWAIQNFTYKRGAKKLNRKARKFIPLDKLTGSEGLSIGGDGRAISFDLRTHTDTADASLLSYSLECYIINDRYDVISDYEALEWALEESSAKKYFSTSLSQFQSHFVYALINVLVDKAFYPFCRDNIFEPIKKRFFKSNDSSSNDPGSSA